MAKQKQEELEIDGTKTDDPDAISEARQRVAEAKKGEAPTGEPAPEAPPAPAPPAAGAAATPPADLTAKDAEIEELRRKNEELQKQVDREHGRYGDQLDKLQRQMSQMDEQMQTLTKENERLRGQAEKPPEPTPDEMRVKYTKNVPAQLRDDYGDELVDLIVAVASNVIADKLASQPALNTEENLKPLRQEVEQIKAAHSQDAWLMAIERLAPGFLEYNGDPAQNIGANEDWAKHLREPMNPNIDERTWMDYIQDGASPQAVANIFKAFMAKKKNGQKPPKGETPPSADAQRLGQAAPDQSNTAPPEPPPAPTGPTGTADEYEQLKGELQFGRGDLTAEEYTKKRKRLNELQQAAIAGTLK